MDIETLWNYGMTLPHVTSRSPFGPDTLNLEVGGKMFALMDTSGNNNFYNIKVDPDEGVLLRERYSTIFPAYHMNKTKWISVEWDGGLPDSLHRKLLLNSYREVLKAMNRKQRSNFLEFNIRPTEEKDISRVLEIFDKAREHMRAQGNIEQWTDGYPGEDVVREDMKHGASMVIEHCDEVVGTFCLQTNPEPTYQSLPSSTSYATIHRIASDGSVSGIVDATLDYALKQNDVVRMDTHPDNDAMFKCIKRLKMKPIGDIVLDDNTPRKVFEKSAQ